MDLGAGFGVGKSGTTGLESRNLAEIEEVVHERSDDMAASGTTNRLNLGYFTWKHFLYHISL